MRNHRLALLTLAAVLATGVPPARAAAPFNAVWRASDGALPDSACPKWTYAGSVSAPGLLAGALHIATAGCSQNASYWHTGADFALPDTVVVEARLRVTSMGECVGPCGHYRAGANVAVTVAPNVGVLFHVGNDELWVTTSECGGKNAVSLPTTDAPHTYRLVVAGGQVAVYRDGALAVTGNTYSSAPDHGSSPRVGWGEASSLAYGVSDWEYVKHNAHATGCATTGVGAPAAPGAALALRAWPNPGAGPARIAWTLASAARSRVTVFDAAGRRVRALADAEFGPGSHELAWDGRDTHGRRVPPGAYLVRVDAAGASASERLVRGR